MIQPTINPIITRELRSRMRGRRAFIILTVHLLLLSCVAGTIYTTIYSTQNLQYSSYGSNVAAASVQYGPTIGKAIFSGITLLLLAIVTLIAPAFAAGAIAGERERKTYETLLITTLRPYQIVWGKLGALFTFLLLLILAALPIQSLVFLFGGVALAEVVIAALALLVSVLAFGALGLYISSLARTTMMATMICYGLIIPFIYGLPILLLMSTSLLGSFLFGSGFFDEPPGLLTILLMIYGGGFLVSINPFSSAILTGVVAANGDGYFFFKFPLPASNGPGPQNLWLVSPWLVYVIFYTLMTLLLVFLTIRRLGKISNT